MLKALMKANRQLSDRIGRRFRHLDNRLEDTFLRIVEEALQHPESKGMAIEVGAGRATPLGPLARAAGERLVCVDVSAEELRRNSAADVRVAADAARLPFADDSAKLLVSRFLIEHLADSEAFLRETERVLAPGGKAIHILPNGLALYVLVSRLLPKVWSARVVHFLLPWSKGTLGFPAHYDRCTLKNLKSLIGSAGLVLERTEYGYDQSFYVRSFTPLFAAVILYDAVLSRFRVAKLCTSFVLVARKP